jgi:hypothetical protein
MGIDVSWLDESHTTILLDFKGHWTWADLQATGEKTSEMRKTVPHVVDVINDLTHGDSMPSNALSVGRSMTTQGFDVGEGVMIVVHAGSFARSLYRVFQNTYGRRAGFPETHFFETREAAVAYLHEQRRES